MLHAEAVKSSIVETELCLRVCLCVTELCLRVCVCVYVCVCITGVLLPSFSTSLPHRISFLMLYSVSFARAVPFHFLLVCAEATLNICLMK